jgi:uncharacterized glyoxalase superfamily protein PhnB
MILKTHTILYVSDQAKSTAFYTCVLGKAPDLNVPGMTEFQLFPDTVLGLMPVDSIKRLLGDALPDPLQASGIPRAELYLVVDDPSAYFQRALAAGATHLSDLRRRDWGHYAAYCLDLDGHVLAFAKMV